VNWSNELFHAAMGGANYGTLVQAWQEQRQYLFTGKSLFDTPLVLSFVVLLSGSAMCNFALSLWP